MTLSALRSSPERVLLPQGFAFSAIAAGIKASGRPDLGFVEVKSGGNAAAVFTRNRVVAAPVEYGRNALRAGQGRIRATIVNSGNANCATGTAGWKACEQVCRQAAALLNVAAAEIFPSSTGIIGVQLPYQKITRQLAVLARAARGTRQAASEFARAIMTTDTRPKIAAIQFAVGRKAVTILGIAKGAGMIHPQLATMLVYLFTDVSAAPRELQSMLRDACDDSLNCISIDGDTSTNDTALLVASGAAGIPLSSIGRKRFAAGLGKVCQSLAEQIVSDGEGVQHVIRLHVEQGRTRAEALAIARTIAHSPLVKTAWAGAAPNWGRILAAIGRSGVSVDSSRISVEIAGQMVCRRGAAFPFDEKKAHRALSKPVCDVRITLGRGSESLTFLTTDLTSEYVHINSDYST